MPKTCALCQGPDGVFVTAPVGDVGDRCCAHCFSRTVTPAAAALAARSKSGGFHLPSHASHASHTSHTTTAESLALRPVVVSEFAAHDVSRTPPASFLRTSHSDEFRIGVVPVLPDERASGLVVDVVLVAAPGVNVAFGGNAALRERVARMLDDVGKQPADTAFAETVTASASTCGTTNVACVTRDETVDFEPLDGGDSPVFSKTLSGLADRHPNSSHDLVDYYERACDLLRARYEANATTDEAAGTQRAAAIVLLTDGAWTTASAGTGVGLDDDDNVRFLTPTHIRRVVDAALAPVLPAGACGLYAISGAECRHNYFESLVYGRGVAAYVSNAEATVDVVRAFNRVFGDILSARARFELRATARRVKNPNRDGGHARVDDVSTTHACFGLLTPGTHGGRVLMMRVPASLEAGDEIEVAVEPMGTVGPMGGGDESRLTIRVEKDVTVQSIDATFRTIERAVDAARPSTASPTRFRRKRSRSPPVAMMPLEIGI